MRWWLLFGVLGVAWSSTVTAEAIKPLDTINSGRNWSAVGKLTIQNGQGFCTATLVSEDLVLTAAHCLYDPKTNARLSHQDIEFQAGLRNGRAEAYRKVRNVHIHPLYQFEKSEVVARVPYDIALIELVHPIRQSNIVPMLVAEVPQVGRQLSLVSYARGRQEAPSLQSVCDMRARQAGILVLSCDVDYGASGAPVIQLSQDGPYIVSVVSAMAELRGERVSLGLGLVDAVKSGGMDFGVWIDEAGRLNTYQPSDQRRDIGAKFARP